MNDIERIYSLLTHSNGLKIRSISQELELDKYYVAEIMFSSQNIPYWYQDDDSLWYAKEGALQTEEPEEKIDELLAPAEIPQRFNIEKFLKENLSNSLRAYLEQISKFRLYSNEETLELFRRYRAGDKTAFDLIIKSQQRLVVNIALLYSRKGAPLQDIIQEGNIGLVKAAERFDYLKYRSFSNYAKSWVLQSISFAMAYLPYVIRLPLNQLGLYRRVRRFKEKYEQIHGFPPSVTDIEGNFNIDKIEYLDQLPDSLLDLLSFHDDMDSFESSLNTTELFIQREYDIFRLRKLLKSLSKREEQILLHFYGINVAEETLTTIGDKFYLTRERVRQIKEKAIRKLKELSGIERIVYKIGDYVRLNLSNQIGRVIEIRRKKCFSDIYVLQMDKGYKKEVEEDDIFCKVFKDKIKKKVSSVDSTKTTERKSNDINDGNIVVKKQREEEFLEGVKVGTKLYYKTQYCTVKQIIENEYKKKTQSTQKEQRKKTQKNTFKDIAHSRQNETKNVVEDARREVSEIDELKVGDKIYYNKLSCTVKKIIENGKVSKLIIEYANGVRDVVSYNKSRYVKIQHTRKETHNKPLTKTRHINSKIKREAMVGDRIMYGSRPCLVLEKKTMRNSLRLIVKYDDGSLDNVQNDWDKYRIL